VKTGVKKGTVVVSALCVSGIGGCIMSVVALKSKRMTAVTNYKHLNICTLLGAFAKLIKTTIRFVMSVCSFLRMEQICSQSTDFYEDLYLGIFSKIC
jgi:hypothetical protein